MLLELDDRIAGLQERVPDFFRVNALQKLLLGCLRIYIFAYAKRMLAAKQTTTEITSRALNQSEEENFRTALRQSTPPISVNTHSLLLLLLILLLLILPPLS